MLRKYTTKELRAQWLLQNLKSFACCLKNLISPHQNIFPKKLDSSYRMHYFCRIQMYIFPFLWTIKKTLRSSGLTKDYRYAFDEFCGGAWCQQLQCIVRRVYGIHRIVLWHCFLGENEPYERLLYLMLFRHYSYATAGRAMMN